jgi:uncharacterized protein YndB with AHSA1/START domain
MPRAKLVCETYIRATPEAIWEALTNPDFTRRYYYGCAVESAWDVGAPIQYLGEGGLPAIEGEVIEWDPPRRLVMTFSVRFDAEAAAEAPSRVTWDIVGFDGVSRLTLTHDGFHDADATYRSVATGWTPIVAGLKTLLETGEPMPVPPDDRELPDDLDAADHRQRGIEATNTVFRLFERVPLTDDDAADLVDAAHAARWHWRHAEDRTPVNAIRADYLCARAHAWVGNGQAALDDARRCLDATNAAGLDDFDLAYAHEVMARALASTGDLAEARLHLDKALAVAINDPEDARLVAADLAAGPWYGLLSYQLPRGSEGSTTLP